MDFIILDATAAVFDTAFGEAEAEVQDGSITASGHPTADGTKVCIEGDEATVIVPGIPFTTKTHSDVKGVGILTIKALADDQIAAQTTSGGTPVLLVGSDFEAQLTGVAPPIKNTPNGPLFGSLGPFDGTGHFDNQDNDFFRGT